MTFTLKFSRPKEQPIANASKFRFGFWMDSGIKDDKVLSEAYSCGYGYSPLE